jgi:glycosyltransferase 2 family protein
LKKSKIVKLVLSIVFSVYLIWVFIEYLNYDFTQFPNILSRVPTYIFILIFTVNIFANLIRSVRYKILLQSEVSLGQMFGIINSWQFYNSLLPYRTGELSYIYLLKKKEDITISESTASLFISRIFDLVVFIFCCSITLWLTSAGIKSSMNDIYIASTILFVIAGIGVFLLFKISMVFKIVILLFHKSRLVKFKLIEKLVSFLENIMHSLKLLSSPGKLASVFLITVLLTLLINVNTYIVIRYFGVNLNFFEVFVASSFTFLTIFLPIQGIANIGTYEGSFIIGLTLFGIDRTTGLSAAFALHIIFYLMLVITFIVISAFYIFHKYKAGNHNLK